MNDEHGDKRWAETSLIWKSPLKSPPSTPPEYLSVQTRTHLKQKDSDRITKNLIRRIFHLSHISEN